MLKAIPLRALSNFSGGTFTEEMLQDMIDRLNQPDVTALFNFHVE